MRCSTVRVSVCPLMCVFANRIFKKRVEVGLRWNLWIDCTWDLAESIKLLWTHHVQGFQEAHIHRPSHCRDHWVDWDKLRLLIVIVGYASTCAFQVLLSDWNTRRDLLELTDYVVCACMLSVTASCIGLDSTAGCLSPEKNDDMSMHRLWSVNADIRRLSLFYRR